VAASLRAARPDIALGADMIAGFPTEDEAAFQNGADLVDEIGLAYLHVFPYSARQGTPAARMPQIPMQIRRARAAELRRRGEAGLRRHLAQRAGKAASILVEQQGLGRDETYAPVKLGGLHDKGSVISARVEAARDGGLWLEAA